jgi:hypothetical protein
MATAKIQDTPVVDEAVILTPNPDLAMNPDTVETLDTTPTGGIPQGSNAPGTYILPNGTQIVNY